MADVHRLPDERKVTQEASAWLARLKADDVTAADHERFAAWRRAHPMHGRIFDEIAGTWERFAAARSLVHAVASGQSMSAVARAVAPKSAVAPSAGRRIAWAAVAIGILVGTGLLAYLRLRPGTTYDTAIGEHATISLPDGSTLELNSDSRARMDYSATNRIVLLERGEAFFKVVHDPERPFWVVAKGVWVRDVGTAFDVDIRSDGVRVTVNEGTVKVGAINPLLQELSFNDVDLTEASAISLLTAGHEADLHGSRADVRALTPDELARAVSWRTGTLYFEDQPLAAVVEELKRYTPLNIVISDERLRQLRVGGTFQANPEGVEAFLTMLSQGLGLDVQREAGRIVIGPAAAKAD